MVGHLFIVIAPAINILLNVTLIIYDHFYHGFLLHLAVVIFHAGMQLSECLFHRI